MKRREKLTTGEIYHVFNKSIAGFKIFSQDVDIFRIIDLVCYYRIKKPSLSFSHYLRGCKDKEQGPSSKRIDNGSETLVQILAYCVMPTHLHLILKQQQSNGISIFMNNLLNAYSRYFNVKFNRKGPLWEGRFKSVLVTSDEQLLHLTRYIHLNPVTARLIDEPQHWHGSSYKEYILASDAENQICCYRDVLDINPTEYKNFVNDRIAYQRDLADIKNLIFE